ncbi:MAG TPA: glucosamine-6-phosphate deaminase [Candidatus Aquilonibacter sp.]|nr:glucosamine-6-phosphate deaminase [Candidatus Aquilonibacter sp.]
MVIKIFEDKSALSRNAAAHAAGLLREAIEKRGSARIIAATGMSQIAFLGTLTKADGIDWPRVEMFHLDEYIGLPVTHPASFRKYLLDNLISKTHIAKHHLLDGERDPEEVIARVGKELSAAPIDVAFVGIGENGHLAFNDPPANFETDEPYLIVALDQACRRQQVGEGWFASVAEVPTRAISMSVRQILKAQQIIAVVPDARKANAVKLCLEGEITPMAPASILRTHPATTLYLDKESAALLAPDTIRAPGAAG